MTTWLKELNQYNPLASGWIVVLAVTLLIPALYFYRNVPYWAPTVALIGLGLLVLLRTAAVGHFIGHPLLDWSTIFLFLLLILGLWIWADLGVSLPLVYALIANLTIFWVVAAQRNRDWLYWTGWLLMAVGLVLGCAFLLGTNFSRAKLPFIDPATFKSLPSWRSSLNPLGFDSNVSGGLIALFVAPTLALAWAGKSWQQRDVAKLVALALFVMVIITQSRGALLGISMALITMVVINSSRLPASLKRWLPFLIVALAALALVAAFLPLSGLQPSATNSSQMIVSERRDVLGDRSLQDRQTIWRHTFDLMLNVPLTGVGPGMAEATTMLIDPDYKNAHNIYLQTGAEMGIPGLLVYVWLYLSLLYLLARRALDHNAGDIRILALGLLGSLVVFLVHGFFEVITRNPIVAVVVWGLLGLMVAVSTCSINPRQIQH